MKKAIITVLVALTLAGLYYGAYLPFVRAKLLVSVMRNEPQYRTLNELKEGYRLVFDFPSPIGQYETFKFFSGSVADLILGGDNLPEEELKGLVELLESQIYENDAVHLLGLGYLYTSLWQRFKSEEYLVKAEDYYKRVFEIGPNIPHALYALIGLYRDSGNEEKMREVGEWILELWPDDKKIAEFLGR